jgi:hypothetical protein
VRRETVPKAMVEKKVVELLHGGEGVGGGDSGSSPRGSGDAVDLRGGSG